MKIRWRSFFYLDTEVEMPRERRRLVIARQAKGWQQYVLAGRANIQPSMLSRIEAGLQQPPVDVAVRLAEVLSLPPGAIFPEMFNDKTEEVLYGAKG